MEASKKFKPEILDAIKNLHSSFNENEIAYLALTSKIENPIRDKIAFLLHSQLSKDYLICREFKAEVNNRVDLAILDRNLDRNNDAKCLIEFKAHSSMWHEKEYKDHLKSDLNKIACVANEDTELFYIFLCNVFCPKIDFDKYEKAVKYHQRIKSYCKNNPPLETIKTNLKTWWFDNSYNKNESTEVLTIDGGNYYGTKVEILAFIHGPFNKQQY